MVKKMNLWEEFKIEHGETIKLQIGALSVWIEHRGEEYLFTYAYGDDNNDLSVTTLKTSDTVPDDLTWSRYIVQNSSIKFKLAPVLPDRAVVVNPEFPVTLAPNSDVLFFMSIPLWVKILSGSKKMVEFLEIPSQVLSNTWFGDSMNGELCYALTTRALINVEGHGVQPQRIVCPVRILNKELNAFDFQSLCVHVEHLKVYSGTKHLWSNEVTITYKGNEQPSEVRYIDRVPKYEKDCVLLSLERQPAQKRIISRSFSLLKSFTTFD